MKARLTQHISTKPSMDHYYIPALSRLIIFGHEGPSILYDTSSSTPTEMLNIGRVVKDNGGLFVNVAARSDKIAAFADYRSKPNILVIADLQNGHSKAITTPVGKSVRKLTFSPGGALLALGSNEEKSKVCIYDVHTTDIVASFDGCMPFTWKDDDALFYWNRSDNSVYCKRISSGSEQSVATISSGYLSAILYHTGNVFFSINQDYEAGGSSEVFGASTDDFIRKSLAKFDAGIEFISPADKDHVVFASAWHGDSEENGKIRVFSLLNNTIALAGIYDSGYGNDRLYSPYATLSIEGGVLLAWRSERAKVFVAKHGMSPHEVFLPNYYPEIELVQFPDINKFAVYSVHLEGLNDKVYMSIGQRTNILVYEIENT